MHAMTCRCPQCRGNAEFERLGFAAEFEDGAEFEGEYAGESGYAPPFDEAEEYELAMELLSISSEDELEQFLGRLVRGAWKGLKKVGSAVGRIAKPLGKVLRGVAKAALPFVGGALGSFIPIPGVGTMIGRTIGQAVSSALEAETVGLEGEMRELEQARRFVRIAGSAARRLANVPPAGDPQRAAHDAVLAAAHRHLPQLRLGTPAAAGGRWHRRGNRIVIQGA